jgi:AcrR family transcriptional regulator
MPTAGDYGDVMTVLSTTRGPGAARSENARRAILSAASELLVTKGYEHLTIEGIAARAHVGKPTIYRWWSSKSALIAECLVAETLMPDSFVPPNTGDVVADLTSWLLEVIRFVNRDNNRVLLRSLVAAAVENADVGAQLALHLGAGPDSLDGRLAAAVAGGELVATAPAPQITDLLIGVIVVRILSGAGFEESDAEVFVRTVLGGAVIASGR